MASTNVMPTSTNATSSANTSSSSSSGVCSSSNLVPLFDTLDEHLLDTLCGRLERVLYTEDSFVIREGDPVDETLFVTGGRLNSWTTNRGGQLACSPLTTNGGRTGFFNVYLLMCGDFCGEELFVWDANSPVNLPTSTRTVQALSEVEAFVLKVKDLKFVAAQFRGSHQAAPTYVQVLFASVEDLGSLFHTSGAAKILQKEVGGVPSGRGK